LRASYDAFQHPIGGRARSRSLPDWADARPMRSWQQEAIESMRARSGALTERADAAWMSAGLNRITLHECRHTVASR
jgi:hypothetical protein